MKADLTNREDVDVSGWLQSVVTDATSFDIEYGETPSCRAYDDHAADIVRASKELVNAIDRCRRDRDQRNTAMYEPYRAPIRLGREG